MGRRGPHPRCRAVIPAPVPDDEPRRLAALGALGILDTGPEEGFDRVTRLAQRVLEVPIALVSLIDRDRQWFKSNLGLDGAPADRDLAFCAHAIVGSGPMVVEDALVDPRFSDHPSVLDDPSIRFYAGVPVLTPDGHAVGTLCVIDHAPRRLDDADLSALTDLASVVEHELAIRHQSVTDRLTGLYNRRGLDLAGPGLVELADQLGHPLSLLFVDLDDMKPINDRYGHAAGDEALVAGATLLRRVVRRADLVARIGGDEFVVVLSGAGTDEVGSIVRRLGRAVVELNADSGRPWDLRLSVGTATRVPGGEPFERLLDRADAAMYRAKQSTRAGAAHPASRRGTHPGGAH